MTQQNLDKYNSYRYAVTFPFPYPKYNTHDTQTLSDAVEARGHFTGMNRPPGNENRRWHGTRRKCTLGDKGCTTFCSDAQCSLCCIVKTSFDLAHFGKKTSWGRFGPGIYTSSTSSKFVSRFPVPPRSVADDDPWVSRANDYSSTDSSSPWKAILLNKVVVGKGYKVLHDNPSMAAPPSGYDSVSRAASLWSLEG